MPARPLPTRRRLAPVTVGLALAAGAGLLATSAPTVAAPAPAPASASDTVVSTTTTTDPDDTEGRLDIRSVSHRVTQLAPPRGAVRVRWTVRTHGPFNPAVLQNHHRRFTLELDTDGEPGAERNIRFVMRDAVLVAEVESNATREVIATLPARVESQRVLSTAGYKGLVGARRYFWYANYHAPRSPSCGREEGYPVTCQDSVPEKGWIRLDRPAWPEDPE